MAYQRFGRNFGASVSRGVLVLVAGLGGLVACGGSDGGGGGSQGGAGGTAGSSGSGGSGGTAASGGSSTGGSSGSGTGATAGTSSGGTATGGSAGSTGGSAGSSSGGTATGGSGGTATGGSGGTTECKTNTDCSSKEYCKKSGCKEAIGQCEKRPEACRNTEEVVCGCDGVTYWNSCLAAHDGVNVGSKNECKGSGAQTCGGIGGVTCKRGLKCSQVQDQCGVADLGGTCWKVPDSCPPSTVGSYRKCSINPGAACASLCDAVSSGDAYRFDRTCR